MYKYVISFEGLKPNLTLFDTSKIKAIVITPFDGQKSVVGK